MPLQTEYNVVAECYTERWALDACRSAAFVRCLKAFGVAPTMAVGGSKCKTLTIGASDVYAARSRFFAVLELDQDACAMTSVGDKLVGLFHDWLLRLHSARYRSLATEDQRVWLQQVVILVIARHLMEQKYARYAEGRQTFADPWVCGEVCRLQLLNKLSGELARLVHHIVRDPERQQALIDQFHADLETRMSSCPSAPPESLPPLPEGVVLPFALLSRKGGDR